MNKEKIKTGLSWTQIPRRVPLVMGAVALIAAIGVFLGLQIGDSKDQEAQVTALSTLERIVNVSDLSTFTAVYNGIAEVSNEKNPDKVDFYVSYEAQVEAGIDFSAIEIHMEGKTITVDLPEARINDANVDISSMDFMFFNDRANTSTVSERAYKACEKDVQAESENQGAILELAHQNAQNVIRALVQPVIEPLGEEYELVVN